MNSTFLLSGPIYKTTKLSKWIKNKESVDGILQPVIGEKRYIKLISTDIIQLLEISPDSNVKNILSMGSYKFSSDVFTWARSLLFLVYNKNPEWLIIDEVGKLEMEKKVLEPAISKILNGRDDKTDMNVVFVVGGYLVPDFLNKYV